MRQIARNQIKGKIIGVQTGQTTGHVRIDIGNGVIITSSITSEAIDDLDLKIGDDAFAVSKASDVTVAKLCFSLLLMTFPGPQRWPLRGRAG